MSQEESNYKSYYLKAMKEEINGFKPVLGGTGLGKTFGIRKAIESYTGARQFIYVAHRKNLLNEMAASLTEENISYKQVLRDSESLKEVVKQGWNCLESFFNHPISKKYKLLIEQTRSPKELNTLHIKKQFIELERLFNYTEKNTRIGKEIEDAIGKCTSEVLTAIKLILRFAAKVKQGELQKPLIDTFKLKEDDHKNLFLCHAFLEDLFPFYTAYNSTEKHVTLITLQKLLHGVFNGSKNRKISGLKNFIVFLDEYDFLEPVILDSICQSKPVQDPLQMLSYFYSNVRVKLIDSAYPRGTRHKQVRKDLTICFDALASLVKKYKFPDVRHFRQEGFQKNNWLFNTNHAVIDKPFYVDINEDFGVFEIQNKKSKSTLEGFKLVRAILANIKRIQRLFTRLKIEDEDLYQQLLDDAFSQTDYRTWLNRLEFYYSFETLTKLKPVGYDHHMQRGYELLKFVDPKDETEPDEVKIAH